MGMRLRLTYRGSLRSAQKANLPHIHDIRRSFHKQMKACWDYPPLSLTRGLIVTPAMQVTVIEARKGFLFAPLITSKLHLTTEIAVLFLRAADPGDLFPGGDLDNRIKTLLDALRMPGKDEINSANLTPQADEEPFFCLLQDDALVTGLTVTTDRFLDAVNPDECLLVVSAELHTSNTTWVNLALI
jgi:hypothetical protein